MIGGSNEVLVTLVKGKLLDYSKNGRGAVPSPYPPNRSVEVTPVQASGELPQTEVTESATDGMPEYMAEVVAWAVADAVVEFLTGPAGKGSVLAGLTPIGGEGPPMTSATGGPVAGRGDLA